MYASGVMYSIQTIGTLRHHPVISYLLQINPAAVYIDLVRNAILETQRVAAPGAKPYNARICDLFYHNPKLVNASAYCHPTITTNQLWIYGAFWAVVALVAGFLLFWEAETRYGRG
jgi:teichoic acid transport system permease protein